MNIFTRVLVGGLLIAPFNYFIGGEISIGELCIIIALALILIQLSDINDKLKGEI